MLGSLGLSFAKANRVVKIHSLDFDFARVDAHKYCCRNEQINYDYNKIYNHNYEATSLSDRFALQSSLKKLRKRINREIDEMADQSRITSRQSISGAARIMAEANLENISLIKFQVNTHLDTIELYLTGRQYTRFYDAIKRWEKASLETILENIGREQVTLARTSYK